MKSKKEKRADPLLEAINEIQHGNPELLESDDGIVDVITFCDDPRYLNLLKLRFNLRLSQRVILKTFYMGTRGNENLKLNKEEWEWIYEQAKEEKKDDVVYSKNIDDVIQKLLKKEKENFNFRELHLVLGRRGGKTILASVISAYEAYKLLVIGNGNPQKYYEMPEEDEIAIINVALSQKQAGRLFGQIQTRLRNSPFFKGRIAKSTTSEIRLYTDADLEKKKVEGDLAVQGSILILCGHSNPDTLAGYNAILILFDELAFYDESGKITGKYFYTRLKPSLAQFYKYGDGRIVQISSPNIMDSIFYETFVNSKKFNHILSFQLPTWVSNPTIGYEHEELRVERERNPEGFSVEFGAQWARSGIYGYYFPEDLVTRCIETGVTKGVMPQSRPEPGFNYYLHIDPAKNGNRYVALLVAKERYTNHIGRKRIRVRLANMWLWEPKPGVGLIYVDIDRTIIDICRLFRPLIVSYDQYNSIASLQLLRSRGINAIQTSYNRAFKMRIYQNLREMMAYQPEPEVWLYDDPKLILEMRSLRYRPTIKGISFIADKHGEIKTDDVCVDSNTIIFTDNDPKEIKNINIGDKILTTNGDYKRVIDKIEHFDYDKLFQLKPYYGEKLIATNNHPVEILRDGRRKWERIDKLTKEDYVLKTFDNSVNNFEIDLKKYVNINVNKHHNIKKYVIKNKIRQLNSNAKWHNRYITDSKDLGYIVGLYLAEGSLANHGISFAGNIYETDIHKKIIKAINRTFGIKIKGYYHNKKDLSKGCQLNINSQIIKKLFIELFGSRISVNKFISLIFMQANLDFQKALIQGLYDGDGCYGKKKKRILFTTTSIYLAHQIQQVLLRFGIISSFTFSKREGKLIKISGRNTRHNKDLYNIQITDADSFNILSDILEIGVKKKQSKFHNKKYKFFDGFVACKIRSIEEKKEVNSVLNLLVEDQHTYVSASVNSHNCDCLAGACATASENLRMALPEGMLVRTGYM